eukprot:scaffold1484_cov173-Amphora_coffeaeformis.AAC.25
MEDGVAKSTLSPYLRVSCPVLYPITSLVGHPIPLTSLQQRPFPRLARVPRGFTSTGIEGIWFQNSFSKWHEQSKVPSSVLSRVVTPYELG